MLAAISGNNTFLALAIIHTRQSETEFLVMIDGNVHIDRRGQGLGSNILRWMEGRAREEFDKIDQGTPLVIRTSCADHLTDRIRLFEQYGFRAVR